MKLVIPRPRKRNVRPPPPHEPDSIEWNGVRINFSVVRSARRKRTITLRVLRGEVEVLAPVRTPKRDIRASLCRPRPLGRSTSSAIPQRPPDIPAFGCGDTVPYLGSDTSISIEPGPVGAVEVSLHDEECNIPDTDPKFIYIGRKHFHVKVPANIDDGERQQHVRDALVRWYSVQAEEHFSEEVAVWLPDVAPRAKAEIRISNARSQWGSCSRNGVLRFSWRCMMLAEWQIEYIVVHELAHLKVRNHSKAFWRVVTKAMPDAIDWSAGASRRRRGRCRGRGERVASAGCRSLLKRCDYGHDHGNMHIEA